MEKLKLGNTSVSDSRQYFIPLLSSYVILFDWEMVCVGGWEVVFTSPLPFFFVPLRTAVELGRSAGQADSWQKAGRMRETELPNLLEINWFVPNSSSTAGDKRGYVSVILPSLFFNWKARRIAAGCCRDSLLTKYDVGYAAESPVGDGGC